MGDLAWLQEWANVDIWHIDPNGNPVAPVLWEGLICAFEDIYTQEGADNFGLNIHCMGALHQISLYVRAPSNDDTEEDIGTAVMAQFDHTSRPALRTNPGIPVATGLKTRYRGAWEMADEYITQVLNLYGITTDETQYCVYSHRPRTPIMFPKDRTTVSATISAGAPGVEIDIQRELINGKNCYYGNGIDTGGGTWGNSFPQPTGIFYEPLAYDPQVHDIDVLSNGNLNVVPGRLVPTKIRNETFQQFGQGVDFDEGVKSAQNQYNRLVDPGYQGTITLYTDPEEISRLAIREGFNVRLKNYRGTGDTGVIFHVAQVQVSPQQDPAPKVTLTVDTKARDLPTVASIIQRNRQTSRQPLYNVHGQIDSTFVRAQSAQWDTSRGAGTFPNSNTLGTNNGDDYHFGTGAHLNGAGHRYIDGTSSIHCPAKQWTIAKFLASERDNIIRTLIVADAAVTFHASIYNEYPDPQVLPANPFSDPRTWDLNAPPYLIVGWGAFSQHAGYSPGSQTAGDAITGRLEDNSTWSYSHDNNNFETLFDPTVQNPQLDPRHIPYLWVAIWPDSGSANFCGILTKGPWQSG